MLDNLDVSRILRSALAGGGEFADIYFEEGSSTTVVCEDGKIEKVLAGTDRGVGIRVISDLRTAYAYTNEITEAALFDLADTVLRFQILKRPGNGYTALACVAKQSVISQYESLLRELGLEPWNVGVSSFHVLNLYSPYLSKKSPVFAIAHLMEDSFTTIVEDGGGTRFYRYKDVKRAGAVELKARFMREIEDSLHFYTHMDRTQTSEVQHLYLSGDSDLLYELCDGLSTSTPLTVEVLSPADVIARNGQAGTASAWLVVMAAALGAGSTL